MDTPPRPFRLGTFFEMIVTPNQRHDLTRSSCVTLPDFPWGHNITAQTATHITHLPFPGSLKSTASVHTVLLFGWVRLFQAISLYCLMATPGCEDNNGVVLKSYTLNRAQTVHGSMVSVSMCVTGRFAWANRGDFAVGSCSWAKIRFTVRWSYTTFRGVYATSSCCLRSIILSMPA